MSLVLYVEGPGAVDLVVTLDAPRFVDVGWRILLLIPEGRAGVASNTSATLWDQQQDPPTYVYETWGIERDNEVNGTWTLHIEDKGQGAPGTLIGFVLTVTSRYD